MKVELDGYLGYAKYQASELSNSNKRYLSKTTKGILGKMDLKLAWDRDASFKLKFFLQDKKKDVLELERKVIALYAMGTSTRDAIIIKEF